MTRSPRALAATRRASCVLGVAVALAVAGCRDATVPSAAETPSDQRLALLIGIGDYAGDAAGGFAPLAAPRATSAERIE